MTLFYNLWNIIGFIATTLSFPYWQYMPNGLSLIALIVVFITSCRLPFLFWIKGMMLAIVLVSLHSQLFRLKIDTAFHAGNDITINVRVDSFFNKITHGEKYRCRIESINGEKLPYFLQPIVSLTTPLDAGLKLGDRWQFDTTLKPVVGRLNEAGFDLERYYLSQGWHATAAINDMSSAKKLMPSNSLRLALYEKVSKYVESMPSKAIVLALSFGERNEITPETWQALKASGLAHLVAISGLHIGIAYIVGWQVGKLVRILFSRWEGAPFLCAIIFAALYSWLAGFSLPTVRALCMCGLLGYFSHIRIKFSAWQNLLLTMAILLAINPFSSLTASFWMSFSAVASIYLVLSLRKLAAAGEIKKITVMQLGLTTIMMPITAQLFGGVSTSSSLYNLLFVPWFSVVIVPTVFLGLLFTLMLPTFAGFIWSLVDLMLSPVIWSMTYSPSTWISVTQQQLMVLWAIILFLILRPFITGKLHAVLVISLLLMFDSKRPENKQKWRLSMLDVGHGLAILIDRGGKQILYDTGNAWRGGSYAQSAIEPVLNKRSANKIDMMILSHLDSDHAGGRFYIDKTFNPNHKLSSQSDDGYLPCISGEAWQWEGLDFTVVWPPKLVSRAYNPHSCVVRVSDGVSSVLLTGDVEAISELILAQQPEKIASDILIVPHHGSKTSSTSYFIDAVNPSVALASTAKNSRWDIPHHTVLQKYQERNIKWLDTGENGQISIIFNQNGVKIVTERDRQSLSWYRQKLRKGVE